MLSIETVNSPERVEEARTLFRAYAEELDEDLCFQGFQRELDTLPGAYAPPGGELLLARWATTPAGCIALRKIDAASCEVKRLYVDPAYRGLGIGRVLTRILMDRARARGYRVARLDTLERMEAARALYRSLGFVETEPYSDNPLPGVIYMACPLGGEQ
ncbi:MAG: GNAT family N-acetyltransferase [Rhodothermales bacterium]|nr:GNAT family N-acetyltransferase [Rhodothermales bacterium]